MPVSNKRVCCTLADGRVRIKTPMWDDIEGIDEDQAIARATAQVPADAINVVVVGQHELPQSRTFRNALSQSGSAAPAIDMPKARNIHRARIKERADKEIDRLVGERARAVAKGDTVRRDEIDAEIADLDGVEKRIVTDSVGDPDQLEVIWPPGLSRT